MIEQDEGVAICLAVESGSRAWGFPSKDSDFDVRFIYVHRPEWYLSINLEMKRDVIERPIADDLDISGWDIRKALRLFRKSNPPLLEWLQCPLIYQESFSLARRMRELLPTFYSSNASYYHYLHMAQGNLRDYLRGPEVWQKKYFYVLRPLLAIHWIERKLGPVPIQFERLVEATAQDPALRRAIDELLKAKKSGKELDKGPRIEIISSFIETELDRLANLRPERASPAPAMQELDGLFRDVLDEVWK